MEKTTTIANVMKGSALLLAKTPDTHRAEWSTVRAQSGTHSVKLSKPGTAGGYCMTYLEFVPTGLAAALKISDLEDAGVAANWGWSHFRSPIEAYWEQFALRFKDPNSNAFVDITIQVDVMEMGSNDWQAERITATVNKCFFGGWSETAGYFGSYVANIIYVDAAANVSKLIVDTINGLGGSETNADDWELTLVRLGLYETNWERHVYVDDILLADQPFTLEPGGEGVAEVRLDSAYTELGYTEEGVIAEYTVEEADIEVDEETFAIDRVITKEGMAFTCSLAEATMANMALAMAGSVLSGATLKFGAGVNKKLGVQILAINPASKYRSITMPSCTATGNVAMTFQKDGKVLVPVTFMALKPQGEPAVTVVENVA